MNHNAFFHAAEQLSAMELPVYPLLSTEGALSREEAERLARVEGGILTGSAAAVDSCVQSDARSVFLSAAAPEDTLRAVHGRCRYLAETPDEIRRLDALTGPYLREGYLEDIAIRVRMNGGGAFAAERIPEFARLIRRTENLAVRALFLPFEPEGDLPRQAKDAFSLVKKIRSDMPCMLHAFCFEGLLEPVAQGNAELLQTLRMLASLNDTSLYARFFIC